MYKSKTRNVSVHSSDDNEGRLLSGSQTASAMVAHGVRAQATDDQKVAVLPPFGRLAQRRRAVLADVGHLRQVPTRDRHLRLRRKSWPKFGDDGRDPLADNFMRTVRVRDERVGVSKQELLGMRPPIPARVLDDLGLAKVELRDEGCF
jgi:hypothetical protein